MSLRQTSHCDAEKSRYPENMNILNDLGTKRQTMIEPELLTELRRIADALERLSPTPSPSRVDSWEADAFVWSAGREAPLPVEKVNRIDIGLLKGIDGQRDRLLANTERFADGLPANNALLWGARGTGKSSLIKAVHGAVNARTPGALALIEIHREEIESLPRLLALIRNVDRRCLIFCDDLSFDAGDASYKSLKAAVEGGLEGKPGNALFYATSNRRHLMPRDMIENERSSAVNPSETIEEKVSLSDRFGLWLGFHNVDQQTYFEMLDAYVDAYDLKISQAELRALAVEWSSTRGARSGRVAWQFIQDLAGRLGKRLG